MSKAIDRLDAWYHGPQGQRAFLGSLGVSESGRIGFEVGEVEVLKRLSPMALSRADRGVVFATYDEAQAKAFDGLFGLFADSLPDTFGLEVVRARLRTLGYATGALEILAYLGEWGRGAISYEPSLGVGEAEDAVDIEDLFSAGLRVQDGEVLDLTDPFSKAMGSAGGTRPKAFVVMQGDGSLRTVRGMHTRLQEGESAWMVKFDCTGYFKGRIDHETRIEAAYLHSASEAGIAVPEFRGIQLGDRYHLATRRFDRTGSGAPLHLHSLWGLVQAPTGSELASYDTLGRAAVRLTSDLAVGEEVFRRLAFNVLSGNRDDHPKQHAFLHDGQAWSLSPAYDLTFSERSLGQSMPVLGSVKPDRADLLTFAKEMEVGKPEGILEEVAEAVLKLPGSLLDAYGIPRRRREQIAERISANVQALGAGRSMLP